MRNNFYIDIEILVILKDINLIYLSPEQRFFSCLGVIKYFCHAANTPFIIFKYIWFCYQENHIQENYTLISSHGRKIKDIRIFFFNLTRKR